MENFITELYRGSYHPDPYADEEYYKEKNKMIDNCDRLYKQLTAKLTEEGQALYQQLKNHEEELWANEVDRAFARGVKIGMQLQKALDEIKL